MHTPGDDQDLNPVDPSSASNEEISPEDADVVTPLHANQSPTSTEQAQALQDYSEKTNIPDAPSVIPVVRQSLPKEFWGFIVHNKAWWMTPIILVLAFMVGFILMAESTPVLPFIYTVL